MSRIVDIPAQFDDRGFEQFVAGIGAWPPEQRLFLDARGVLWSSPYSLLGLLTAGQAIREAKGEKPLLAIPANDDVRSYWSRMRFFEHAADLFELHGRLPRPHKGGRQADTGFLFVRLRPQRRAYARGGVTQDSSAMRLEVSRPGH